MNNILIKYFHFSFLLFPLTLILGAGLADSLLSVSLIIFIYVSYLNRDYKLFTNKFFLVYFILCLYLILLSIFSKNILLSLESSLFYFRFGIFVLAIIYISETKPKFLYQFFLVLSSCIIIISLDAIYEFFYLENLLKFLSNFEPNILELKKNNLIYSGRISGVFGDEFILGSYLVRTLPITIGLLILNFFENKNLKYMIFFLLCLTSFTIFITGERTAFFLLILFLFSFFFIIREYRRLLLFFFSLGIISVLILFFTNNISSKRIINLTFDQVFNKDISNSEIYFFSTQHEVVYKTALKIYKDNIIFGIGPKMFREVCKDKKYHTYSEIDGSVNGCQSHPHNTYVQIITETGIIGFSILCISLSYIIYRLFFFPFRKEKKVYDKYELFEIFCLLNIFINLWPLIPSGNFFNNWLSYVYYLPVGFYIYSYRLNAKRLATTTS